MLQRPSVAVQRRASLHGAAAGLRATARPQNIGNVEKTQLKAHSPVSKLALKHKLRILFLHDTVWSFECGLGLGEKSRQL